MKEVKFGSGDEFIGLEASWSKPGWILLSVGGEVLLLSPLEAQELAVTLLTVQKEALQRRELVSEGP